jgi:PIN domain nuclease of toxin-antitoxin system
LKAILDTHTFLWWNLDDAQLSPVARNFIADGNNELYLSAASAWEIAIKCARGQLVLPEAPDRYVTERMAHYQFLPLPVQLSHALHVFELPELHRDPFDRLLIAQSQLEGLPLLSGDSEVRQYDVEIIW